MKYTLLSSIVAIGLLSSLYGMQPKKGDEYQRIINIIKKSRVLDTTTPLPSKDTEAEKKRSNLLVDLSDLEDEKAQVDRMRLEQAERERQNQRILDRARELADALKGLENAAARSLQNPQV